MTQGRDGISLAPKRAQRLMGVARRLSVVAAMFAIAALVAGIAGTSYAGSKQVHHRNPGTPVLLDQVTVSNYGAAFGGSISTYKAGAGAHPKPILWVKGANTLLGAGTGPEGVSVSSFDHHIAVSVPIDLIDLTGFGGFPAALACTGPGQAGSLGPIGCCTGFHKGNCEAGTGFAEIFSQGATANSKPESILGTRNQTFDNLACTGVMTPFVCCTGANSGTCVFNPSGVNTPQGVAFESPFDGVNPGKDILAVANTLPINTFSTSDFLDGTNGGAACNAFGSGTCTGPGTPQLCCTGVGKGTCAGFTVGTITEYDRSKLAPGFNDNNPPFNNNPVCVLPATAIPPGTEPPTHCPLGSISSATIGGCLTFLLGPVAVAWDDTGFLFVVNEAAVSMGAPGFVSVYAPGSSGDVFPSAVIGLIACPLCPPGGGGTTPPGTFKDPARIAVMSGDTFMDDVIFVSDVGDNTIKVFTVFNNFDVTTPTFFFEGTQIATIKSGFNRPEGVALSVDGTTLYVVNNNTNTLEMFTDIGTQIAGGGTLNLSPTLIVQGKPTKLNFPNDVALSAFTPTPTPTPDARAGL